MEVCGKCRRPRLSQFGKRMSNILKAIDLLKTSIEKAEKKLSSCNDYNMKVQLYNEIMVLEESHGKLLTRYYWYRRKQRELFLREYIRNKPQRS